MMKKHTLMVNKYIQLNNFVLFQRYLSDNNLNVEDFKNEYFDPLIYVIEKKQDEFIFFIIDNYSTFNYELKNGKTPLFVAIEMNNLVIADILINRKADINYQTKNGHNVLTYLAIKKDYSPIHTAYALDSGFRRNYLDLSEGKTFFKYFKGNCSPDQIKLILKDHKKYYYNFIIDFIVELQNKKQLSTDYLKKLSSFHQQKVYMINTLFKRAIKSKKLNILQILQPYSEYIKKECNDSSFRYVIFPYHNECFNFCINEIFGVDYQDKLGKTALMYASKYGLLEVVQDLVENKNANIMIKDNNGDTALQCAIKSGRFGICKYLVHHNGNVNDYDNDGNSLLICATKAGYFSLVKFLIQNHADVNHQNNEGNTALHTAINQMLYMNSIRHLIINKADVNIKNNRGETPLALAINNKFIKAINILLEHKADVNVIDNLNNSILTLAIGNDLSFMIVEAILASGANINVKDANNNTPLRMAIKNGNINTLVRLINYGADINEMNEQGESVLDYAFSEEHIDIAKYLIRKGSIIDKKYYEELKHLNDNSQEIPNYFKNINNENDDHFSINRKIRGYTTLMISCQNNFDNIISYLINQGVDINEKNEYHETALHHAIIGGHYDIVKLLIDHGADIHIKDDDNLTTLMYASREDKKDIVHLLLDRGAKINEKDNEQWTALMFATRNDHHEVVKLLLEHGAQIDILNKEQQNLLTLAAKGGSTKVIDTLIENGIDINDIGKSEVTPLKAAISENDMDMVKCLVAHGINVTSEAAIDSARYNRMEILDYFIKLGIDVNSSNASGSLLMQATRTGNTAMIKLLINKGANINQEIRYTTALRISGIYEYDDIAKILIDNGANVDEDSYEDIIAYRLAGYEVKDKEMYPDYIFKDNNMIIDDDY